jgi:hypothetical protein
MFIKFETFQIPCPYKVENIDQLIQFNYENNIPMYEVIII